MKRSPWLSKSSLASWFAQMSDFGLFCWWNDWRPEMHHTSSSLSKTVTHVHWWTPLFSWRRRASCFLARFLTGTFLSGSLNWACFPLLSNSSPLLSAFLSGPLNWALFWAKLLNWALFWANPLVWALFWALKKAYLLLRARFWVVLLFWALKKALKRVKPLKIALKKALKLRHNLPLKKSRHRKEKQKGTFLLSVLTTSKRGVDNDQTCVQLLEKGWQKAITLWQVENKSQTNT